MLNTFPLLTDIDWSKVVVPVVTAGLATIGTWLFVASRKAAKNFGKAEVEIDEHDLQEAEKAVEAAKLTESTVDDEKAAAWRAKAKSKLDNAKRWQAVLDAVGDADAKE